MNCYPIRERKDWYITDRKPTICPHCGAKEVKKSVFGMPSAKIIMKRNIIFRVAYPIFPSQELGVAVNVMRHFGKILKKI